MSKENTDLTKTAREGAVEQESNDPIYMPSVDICENGDSITLLADMPGVDNSSVDVSVENGVLVIEGKGCVASQPDYELVGQEFAIGKYRRDFTLSEQIDIEGIKAKVRNGVLEVTLPKQQSVKSRKVEITD